MALKFCFNKKKENLRQLRECASVVGLSLVEVDDACDSKGNVVQDAVAIYVENEDSDKMGILLELNLLIKHEIRKQLIEAGVERNKILQVLPDMYTWETYFPEAKGKIKGININDLYEEAKSNYYKTL